ncbi:MULTISPECIES: hypothetical protein [Mycolicibacterium]|uniref:Uncharacterized protein n=1 Tax=Mycolicibacterium vanbaalenii (strain DSM 7251 / JCM 13017 / BCRC 16820 / KCTC 9966 / NRRL B-24157 / PYR-1) TaxID=350058 RepID=A1TGB6_MYCVP|nr:MULTISPECIES: hypothetical protein [Mycolicibacterium]ABM16216.1 hypothetical protein Mvan_5446 [Mycolicibacterium vanbaalenii PYR-1]MCV7126488.1 hypothetical protein [Mycolicibacterium vanbaalenii PYR-1]MDW5611750.1 hypothetical protein [Mycolicibacterium sp. D5.8-2]
MASKPSAKSLAWPLFDALVDQSPFRTVNPWKADGTFAPDYATLRKLLAVPLLLGAESRSGVPALALDVWVAYELRRAGLDPDAVWPRAEAPRVVDRDVLAFIRSVPKNAGRDELLARLRKGAATGGVGAASANIAGKNYFKQVDVIMSSWQTGPELLISTKRMDSSFGKNAANRVEESYGDAKNLALRHPLAALGFMYSLRSTAYTEERRQFDWIVDLLTKLGREEDAYDACALVVPEWVGEPLIPDLGPPEPDDAVLDLFDVDIEDVDRESTADTATQLAALPDVTLRTDLVPDELSPARFFEVMLTIVLDNSNITQHEEARLRRSRAVG